MYSFRTRLRLDPRNRIDSDADELVLSDGGGEGERVFLIAHGDPRPPLSQAAQLVLRGDGYATEAEAGEAAARWNARLRVALTGSLVGADFGLRAPRQRFTPFGLEAFSPPGSRALNDVHGMQIFESDPRPVFLGLDLDAGARRSLDRFLELIAATETSDLTFTHKEELAFELFADSLSEPTADGRFLMLMMAVEVLIVQEHESDAAVAHIDTLIRATRAANLTSNERNALINRLGMLKRESISRGGQRLARTLGARTYSDQAPAEFFKECYGLRSTLVHGNIPYPTFEEVNERVGGLEQFVRDLLLSLAGVSVA